MIIPTGSTINYDTDVIYHLTHPYFRVMRGGWGRGVEEGGTLAKRDVNPFILRSHTSPLVVSFKTIPEDKYNFGMVIIFSYATS